MAKQRSAKVIRKTNETNIQIELNLDGNGCGNISSGIPFFNHMLDLFSKHGFLIYLLMQMVISKLIIIIWLRIWGLP